MAKDEQIADCRDKAVHAYGTGFIFGQRKNNAQKKLKRLSFLGIAVPVLVGGIVVAFFGLDQLKPFLSWLIVVAGLLGTIQLIFTIWSLIAKWDDEAAYGVEASVDNYNISQSYQDLVENPPDNFEPTYQMLNLKNNLRSSEDGKKGITESEKRMGMRAALRKFQRACVHCNKVPYDLKPTDCPVCGNFKFKEKN